MEHVGSVVIVDDAAHVRQLLRSMLELDGFEVVADLGAGVALTELLGHGVLADVIVLDERMPGLDGIGTARLVLAARPEQVVLLYTAFSDPPLERRASEAGITAVVTKVDGLEALEREIAHHSTVRL